MKRIPPCQAALMPIQHLAWLGDAVYELYCRHKLVVEGQVGPGGEAHRAATRFTSASGQAEAVPRIAPYLTEEEKDMLRRGRNAKGLSQSTPDYCLATGLEVVVGWLWLSGHHQRLEKLFQMIFNGGEEV